MRVLWARAQRRKCGEAARRMHRCDAGWQQRSARARARVVACWPPSPPPPPHQHSESTPVLTCATERDRSASFCHLGGLERSRSRGSEERSNELETQPRLAAVARSALLSPFVLSHHRQIAHLLLQEAAPQPPGGAERAHGRCCAWYRHTAQHLLAQRQGSSLLQPAP